MGVFPRSAGRRSLKLYLSGQIFVSKFAYSGTDERNSGNGNVAAGSLRSVLLCSLFSLCGLCVDADIGDIYRLYRYVSASLQDYEGWKNCIFMWLSFCIPALYAGVWTQYCGITVAYICILESLQESKTDFIRGAYYLLCGILLFCPDWLRGLRHSGCCGDFPFYFRGGERKETGGKRLCAVRHGSVIWNLFVLQRFFIWGNITVRHKRRRSFPVSS